MLEGYALLDEKAVGPKFARQASMARAGLAVPKFFCLPIDAFTAVLEPLRPSLRARVRRIDFTDREALVREAEAIREIVYGARVPEAVTSALFRAFDAHFGPDGTVAVRASMVGHGGAGTEDSASDAFAGISDSFLYVSRKQLLDRVKRCWASGFSADALLYRHTRGDDPADFAVSVGVQRMVFGERSFVLFTCDPQTGLRNPVLAAGLGIGEGIVQERVPVDHYFADRFSGEIRSHVVRKDQRMVQSPDETAVGPVPQPVPEPEQDLPALSDRQIREVLDLGSRVEDLFGRPQDIEGTITEDGKIHLLQARPVVLDWDHQQIWSNANITESFSGTTTTLTYSFAQGFYEVIFYDGCRRFGIPIATLERHGDDFAGMIGMINGRIYYALAAWYRLYRQSPLFPLWRRPWERMMGLERTSPEARADTLDLRLTQLPRLAAATARLGGVWAGHTRSIGKFESWWEQTIAAHRTARGDDPEPLHVVEDFRGLWREVGEQWGVTLINDLLLTCTAGATSRLFRRWVPQTDPGLLSDLLCGGEENRSVTILMSMVACAETVRDTPGLMEEVERKPLDEVWADVEAGKYGTDLRQRLREHLSRHGDRGLEELKLEQPNPRARPAELLGQIADYARGDMTVAALRDQEWQTRADGERRLSALLARHPGRRRTLRTLLELQRRYIRFRENSRYCRSELFGHAKETFAALGQALAARGVLDSADDVFHLTQREVFGFVDGTGATRDLRALVAVRRAEYEERPAELPMLFATVGAVCDGLPEPASHESTDYELRGLGSSGGRVRGRAKIVLDPHEAGAVEDGMILVARETDPGWLFLMLSAKGIVVERGTMLSHTAISGRKFGIPTIVSLPHATSRIPAGALIEMDGATGTVTILEEDE